MVTSEDKTAIAEFKAALDAYNKAIDSLNAQNIHVSFVNFDEIGKVNSRLIIGNLRRVEEFVWHGD